MANRRTNRGLVIDIESLIAKSNPNQPAVGNMNVNARGDVLGDKGQIVKKNEQRVRDHYRAAGKTSSSQVSLKDNNNRKIKPDQDLDFDPQENVEIQENLPQENAAEVKPDDTKPLGYKEIELPNGDIEMVPYYQEDNSDATD